MMFICSMSDSVVLHTLYFFLMCYKCSLTALLNLLFHCLIFFFVVLCLDCTVLSHKFIIIVNTSSSIFFIFNASIICFTHLMLKYSSVFMFILMCTTLCIRWMIWFEIHFVSFSFLHSALSFLCFFNRSSLCSRLRFCNI